MTYSGIPSTLPSPFLRFFKKGIHTNIYIITVYDTNCKPRRFPCANLHGKNGIYFFAALRYNKSTLDGVVLSMEGDGALFNIGMMELLVILLVAFLVVGPKDLPKVARWIARQIKHLRRLLRDLKRETGWNELTAEFKDTKDDLNQTLREADVREDLRQAAAQVQQEVDSVREDVENVAQDVRNEMKGGDDA